MTDSQQLNELSELLLLHVKMQKDTTATRLQLEKINLNHLKKSLDNDQKKKAFWINIYNAYFQILRKEKGIENPAIYREKLFTIANTLFSLDAVEHGILRRYRFKYSMGFFPNIFTPRFIKKLAVNKLDYRIHFALNCGAKSCPPIAFYKTTGLNQQLNLATQSFLEGESEFDDTKKIVYTSTLFKWFFADFGGKRGIKKIFQKQLNKDISSYDIKYKKYSWEEDLDNFTS